MNYRRENDRGQMMTANEASKSAKPATPFDRCLAIGLPRLPVALAGRQMRSSTRKQNRGPPDVSKLLTVKDVAEIMCVTTKTVRRWIKSSELEAMRIGRLIRITPDALQQFIEEKYPMNHAVGNTYTLYRCTLLLYHFPKCPLKNIKVLPNAFKSTSIASQCQKGKQNEVHL